MVRTDEEFDVSELIKFTGQEIQRLDGDDEMKMPYGSGLWT